MAETFFVGGLILGGAGARGSEVWAPRGKGCGHPGWSAGLGGTCPGRPGPGFEVRVPGV